MEYNIWNDSELLKAKIMKLDNYDLLYLYRIVNAETYLFETFDTQDLRDFIKNAETDDIVDMVVHGSVDNDYDDIRLNQYGYWESVSNKQLIKEARDKDMIDELVETIIYLDDCSCLYDDVKEVLR